MSVRLITGVPGSGKSYYAAHAITRFADYDPISATWTLRPDVQLYASMDSLRVSYVSLDRLVSQTDISTVFDIDYWRTLIDERKRTLVIIDEAQRWFSSSSRHPDSVWYWFEYHRHLGLEVYLATQSATSMHRRLLSVVDSYIEAAPPSLRLGNRLRYRRRDTTTGEIISRHTLTPDARVYSLYRSAEHEHGNKYEVSAIMKFGILAASFIVTGLFAAPFLLSSVWATHSDQDIPINQQVEPQPTPTLLTQPISPYSLLPGELQKLRLASLNPTPLTELPLSCMPYTASTYRCGPYPTLVSDLPGALCNSNGCVLLLPAPPASERVSEEAGGGGPYTASQNTEIVNNITELPRAKRQ